MTTPAEARERLKEIESRFDSREAMDKAYREGRQELLRAVPEERDTPGCLLYIEIQNLEEEIAREHDQPASLPMVEVTSI